MKADVRIEGTEIVIRLQVDPTVADTLVPISKTALAALGLELKAVRKLIADGALKTVAIGRKTFTKQSALVALVDTLPAARATTPREEPVDDLVEAARKRALRRAS